MRKFIFYFYYITIFFFGALSTAHAQEPLTLTLNEAILLAVRDNPNVQSVQLSYVSQKFNLWVQQWEFYPHYSFKAIAGAGQHGTLKHHIKGSNNFDVQPGVSLLTPIGTQVTLSATNAKTKHYNPGVSLQIVQPLMRGFGQPVVEAALCNARDSEVISRLNIEGTLRNTITSIIDAYLDVVMAESTIKIDEDALKRARNSVKQTKLYIKAGHKAGNELVTVEANVATSQSQLENDKNNLVQARNALLTAIGLDPNTPVKFASLNLDQLIKKYHLPTLSMAKQWVLENDIQYQVDQITLHGSLSRQLMIANDNTRWKLNLSANASTGKGTGGGEFAGFNSLFNRATRTNNVALELTIPIDDQLAKQSVVNAKIALKQAELALLQEKWGKETSAINSWNSVGSTERSLHFAESAAKLQTKTYNLSFQKYLHGLIDSLELQTAQVQLIQAEQTLLNARITYLKALVNLDSLIGNTLKTWDVAVRLS